MGLPPGWSISLDRIPTEGTFKCQYACAPEDRALPDRKRYLEQYGYWQGPNSEEDVDWWSDITNAPPDVVEFLEFLVTKYNNVYDAFVEIDGPNGNKNITHKEFAEGLAHMKFKKFSEGKSGKKQKRKNTMSLSPDDFSESEEKRITNVFRYLDPSGEGQVSEQEWGVLDQLFKETHHSIREFVWFLDRTFENLDDAWEFLAKDAEELDKQAWGAASKSVGYHGPTRPIFSYLDKDGEGTVSCEEFQVLDKFGRVKDRGD